MNKSYREKILPYFLPFLAVGIVLALVVGGTIDIQVRTVGYGGNYSPRNVGAIWIAKANGDFVRTVRVWANARKKHLVKWNNETGGNVVNAITSATLSSHTTHNVTWDCLDFNGVAVPDGDYKLLVEYTEDNSFYSGNPLGPWVEIPFTKAGNAFTLNPPDEQYFKDIQLTYTPPGTQYTLTNSVSGSGAIALNPAGGVYTENTTVEVTAEPAAGWEFSHWTGALSGSANPESVFMDSDKIIAAVFTEIPTYPVNVTISGNGEVTLNPSGGNYPIGTEVTLTALPSVGSVFDSWSGDLNGSQNPVTITVNGATNITANFTEITGYQIIVQTSGDGSVDLSPFAEDNIYAPGSTVTVTASGNPGWTFQNWSGDLSGADSVMTLYMDSHKHITANFVSNSAQELSAGTNVLSQALAAANPGDVFVLNSSGGIYIESNTLELPDKVSLVSAPGLSQAPVIRSSAATIINLHGDAIIRGLKIDGSNGADYGIYNVADQENDLFIDNCEIHDIGNKAIAQADDAPFDRLVIVNSVFHHVDRSVYLRGDRSVSPDIPAINEGVIENCSFYNVGVENIRIEAYRESGASTLRINHVTMDDIGDEALYLRGFTTAPVLRDLIITNSSTAVRAFDGAVITVTYSDIWNNNVNFESDVQAGTGCLYANPLYQNGANGDFALQQGSPCIGAASDGNNIGNTVTTLPTGIWEDAIRVPETVVLADNYPNPFNPSTTIRIQAGYEIDDARLIIFDMRGRAVTTVYQGRLTAGNSEFRFSAEQFASGIYLYRLMQGGRSLVTGKMIYLK
jgi:hypothetical protein